jgi:hypothetical protein
MKTGNADCGLRNWDEKDQCQMTNAQRNPKSKAPKRGVCPVLGAGETPALLWEERTEGGRRPDGGRTLADGGPPLLGIARQSSPLLAFWKKRFFSGFTGGCRAKNAKGKGRNGERIGREMAQKWAEKGVGVPLPAALYRFVPLAAAWRKNVFF